MNFKICLVVIVLIIYVLFGIYFMVNEEASLRISSLLNIRRRVYIHNHTTTNVTSEPKIILAWNDRYGLKNWGFSREPRYDFINMDCSEKNCVVTDDRTKITEADAVLFHIVGDLRTRPRVKLKHQRWVFYETEAPCGAWDDLKSWKNDFNWTQTFRLDSDIPIYYGNYCKRQKPKDLYFDKIIRRKSRLVAWMVSNCRDFSGRIEYVREMMKYISIDVYGACASLFNQHGTCLNHKQCEKMIGNKYKFYLSFENSLTKDYITEKYFKILSITTVPVVRGDGNYTAVGPSHSHINTKDFSNPKQLSEYLLYLDKNNKEYIKYLAWKKYYRSNRFDPKCWRNEPGWCSLCRKLNNPNEPVSYYQNIRKWFGSCRKADDIVT